ncbi:MAG: CoA transferase [Dehalococcoidia bacterium]|nr:CoA transferase [Dehalococcoidia bacterium]
MSDRAPSILPEQFGALRGLRILSTGTKITQPYAAHLAADFGAEVIQVEAPGAGDPWRREEYTWKTRTGGQVNAHWVHDRRNAFYITLDLAKPEGREVFLNDLIPQCDIWMENSKPGTYPAWGITDAAVLAQNPRIIITHVSPFGQTGDPDYLQRSSSSLVNLAFGGLMYTTGQPDATPVAAPVHGGDKIVALYAFWSSLAAYIWAQQTGKGQVIDIAEFECINKITSGTMPMWFVDGAIRERTGNKAGQFQPYDTFMATDGWVFIAAISVPIFRRTLTLLGLDPNDERLSGAFSNPNSPVGLEFDGVLRKWVGQRTVAEVVRTLNEATIPCGPVNDPKQAAQDPHFVERKIHEEWDDEQVGKVKGVRPVPWFSKTPGKIWRGSVGVGHDNDTVYTRLVGLSAAKLKELRTKKVI